MQRSVMPAAEWDRELIADLAAERTGLREPEMMGVGGLTAAHETRLLGDVAQVLRVAIPARSSNSEDALVDALRLIWVGSFGEGSHLRADILSCRRLTVRRRSRIG